MPSGESEPRYKEVIQSADALAIVVDNDLEELRKWSWTIQQMHRNFACIPLGTNKEIKDLLRVHPSLDLTKAHVVIADQFRDGPKDMHDSTKTLLWTVRDSNPHCWTVETSYATSRPVYGHADSIFFALDMDTVRKNLLEGAKKFPHGTLQELGSYFINTGYTYAGDIEVIPSTEMRNYFLRLDVQPELPDLVEQIGLSYPELYACVAAETDEDKRRKIIHGIFTVLGHLSAQRNEDYYGMALSRVKELLGLINSTDVEIFPDNQ